MSDTPYIAYIAYIAYITYFAYAPQNDFATGTGKDKACKWFEDGFTIVNDVLEPERNAGFPRHCREIYFILNT